MKKVLEKLKLIEHLSTEVDCQKTKFISSFKYRVDKGSTNIFLSVFDFLTSSKNKFKGQVDYNGFEVRKRKRLFETNAHFALARGSYKQKGEKLIIEIELQGISRIWLFFFVFVLGLFLTLTTYSFTFGETSGMPQSNVSIIIFALLLLFILVTYFVFRSSMNKMKTDLIREFQIIANR